MHSVLGKSCFHLVEFFLLVFLLQALANKSANSVSENHEILKDTDKSLDNTRISKYYQELWDRHHQYKVARHKSKNGIAKALAIHRGLGQLHDRTMQYRLIQEAFVGNTKLCVSKNKCKILDAGCGMGSAMLYFGKMGWDVEGVTLAENQYNYIKAHFPRLSVGLSSYDEIPEGNYYSGIYAIESVFYSDWRHTLEVWSRHLEYGGRIAIIDDFAVNQSSATSDPDIQGYVKGWMLKAITAVENFCAFATQNARLRCISIRNLTLEFDVNKNNYANQEHVWQIKWKHQAFRGSYFRQKSSLKGSLIYSLVCLEKV